MKVISSGQSLGATIEGLEPRLIKRCPVMASRFLPA